MPARRDPGYGNLSVGMRHYFERGCWMGPAASGDEKLRLFMISAAVLRNNLADLRHVWADVGPLVKAAHPDETLAEAMLAGKLARFADWSPFGRTACPVHPPWVPADKGGMT